MRTLRACWRLGRCVLQIALGLLICAVVLPRLKPAERMVRVGRWCGQMAQVLGIDIRSSGAPQAGPVLIVANHISWLDILVVNAVHPARFVSKADVRAWPVIGWLVASGGTLFIERERKRDALRVVHQIAEALTAGDTIAMFPEGTTGDGRGLLAFHANLLQAAIATATPVQPIALRYRDAEAEPSRAVVWIGDMTLVQSLWSVAAADGLTADVALLPACGSANAERRALSDALRGRIAEALGFDGAAAPSAH